MMKKIESMQLSRFLSLVLRHQPGKIGITLDEQGWTDVDFLLRQMNRKGMAVTPELLQHVVDTNNKKRFAFNETHTKIRANQGHSVAVALGYAPQAPPPILYHGTSKKYISSIMASGLEKRKRHHVHLSTIISTALQVGKRHGDAIVLRISAREMHADGYAFFQSENKVWLTEQVPAAYLAIQDTDT